MAQCVRTSSALKGAISAAVQNVMLLAERFPAIFCDWVTLVNWNVE